MKIIRYEDPAGHIHFADGNMRLSGDPFTSLHPTGEIADIQRLLTPVQPTGLWCIGLNYRQHAAETGAAIPQVPVLFMKGLNTVQHPGEPIRLPRWLRSGKVDFECELAVVIGRAARNVPRSEALRYVAGYMCANDVSARDWQKEGGGSQWCRGKSFDTFGPLGPCMVTPDEIPDPNALRIATRVNGETLQESSTADMVFGIPALIEFLSGSTTLLPGTVILTGTPSGVGMARTPPRWLQPGDAVEVEIEGIGTLRNPVEEEVAEGRSEFRLP